MNGKITYRQQYTRCGKERCRKCKEGAGHGPYWYAYWSENGRTISKYIGIHLPAELESTEKALLAPPNEESNAFSSSARTSLSQDKDDEETRKSQLKTSSDTSGPQPPLRVY